jgi:hypothetical protein
MPIILFDVRLRAPELLVALVLVAIAALAGADTPKPCGLFLGRQSRREWSRSMRTNRIQRRINRRLAPLR